jgi:hypothetical protein
MVAPSTVSEIEQAVRHYLRLHPLAVDTERGIREWWLRDSYPHCPEGDVHVAVERLLAKGELVERKLPDGHLTYAASNAIVPSPHSHH